MSHYSKLNTAGKNYRSYYLHSISRELCDKFGNFMEENLIQTFVDVYFHYLLDMIQMSKSEKCCPMNVSFNSIIVK